MSRRQQRIKALAPKKKTVVRENKVVKIIVQEPKDEFARVKRLLKKC